MCEATALWRDDVETTRVPAAPKKAADEETDEETKEFDEAEHPRDDAGRFADGGGGGKEDSEPAPDRSPLNGGGDGSAPQEFGRLDLSSMPVEAPPGEHVYHATSRENLDGIAARGLRPRRPSYRGEQDAWPDGGREGRVYVATTPRNAQNFTEPGGVLLRLGTPPRLVSEFKDRDYFVRRPVPSKAIDVLMSDGTWRPIRDVASSKTARVLTLAGVLRSSTTGDRAARVELWRAFDASLRPLERRFALRCARAFAGLSDVAVRAVRAGKERDAVLAAVREASLGAFRRVAAEELPAVLKHGWDRGQAAVAGARPRRSARVPEGRAVFGLDWPALTKYLWDRPRRYAPLLTETTVDALRGLLAADADEGLGVDDVARDVARHFAGIAPSRAAVIARTEVIAASNLGAVEAYRSHGDAVGGKEWLATQDDRTRDAHREPVDGQVRPLDEPFDVDGAELDYPGDPASDRLDLIVNCRCTTVPVVGGF